MNRMRIFLGALVFVLAFASLQAQKPTSPSPISLLGLMNAKKDSATAKPKAVGLDTSSKKGEVCPCDEETMKKVDSVLKHMKTPRLDKLTREQAEIKFQIDFLKKLVAQASARTTVDSLAQKIHGLEGRLYSTDSTMFALAKASTEVNAEQNKAISDLNGRITRETRRPPQRGMSTGGKWAVGGGVTVGVVGLVAILGHNLHWWDGGGSKGDVNIIQNTCVGICR